MSSQPGIIIIESKWGSVTRTGLGSYIGVGAAITSNDVIALHGKIAEQIHLSMGTYSYLHTSPSKSHQAVLLDDPHIAIVKLPGTNDLFDTTNGYYCFTHIDNWLKLWTTRAMFAAEISVDGTIISRLIRPDFRRDGYFHYKLDSGGITPGSPLFFFAGPRDTMLTTIGVHLQSNGDEGVGWPISHNISLEL